MTHQIETDGIRPLTDEEVGAVEGGLAPFLIALAVGVVLGVAKACAEDKHPNQ